MNALFEQWSYEHPIAKFSELVILLPRALHGASQPHQHGDHAPQQLGTRSHSQPDNQCWHVLTVLTCYSCSNASPGQIQDQFLQTSAHSRLNIRPTCWAFSISKPDLAKFKTMCIVLCYKHTIQYNVLYDINIYNNIYDMYIYMCVCVFIYILLYMIYVYLFISFYINQVFKKDPTRSCGCVLKYWVSSRLTCHHGQGNVWDRQGFGCFNRAVACIEKKAHLVQHLCHGKFSETALPSHFRTPTGMRSLPRCQRTAAAVIARSTTNWRRLMCLVKVRKGKLHNPWQCKRTNFYRQSFCFHHHWCYSFPLSFKSKHGRKYERKYERAGSNYNSILSTLSI